jgi:hypothetical protein
MWEPQLLATLRASTALHDLYSDDFKEATSGEEETL